MGTGTLDELLIIDASSPLPGVLCNLLLILVSIDGVTLLRERGGGGGGGNIIIPYPSYIIGSIVKTLFVKNPMYDQSIAFPLL
jgi:hypothetical protein